MVSANSKKTIFTISTSWKGCSDFRLW